MSLTISPARIVEESGSPLLVAPASWPRRPLGEIATILNGFAFKSKQFVPDGGKPLIRIRDIFNETTAVGYVGEFEQRYLVQPGDLLVGMDGDFNCARWSGPEALLNQRVCKVTPQSEQLDIDFFARLLPGYLQAIHDLTSSTTVTHLSSRDIAQIPIPVPPLDEQRALAQLFESAGTKQQSSAGHLATARRAIGRFRQTVLAAACSGRLSEDWRGTADESSGAPEGWQLLQLGEVAERVTKGTTPTSYGHKFTESGVSFIKVENLRNGRINRDSGRSFIAEATHHTQARSILRDGDVLFSIAGTIGRTAIVSREDLPANTNQALAIIRGTSHLVTPEYLVIALQSAVQRAAADAARGSGMNNISLTDVRRFELAVPPKSEQQEIVRRVDDLLALADSLEHRFDATSKHIERSSQAVLAKAFRGDLSGNGRSV
jgi:type I restriction enzyme, S subunit